MGSPLDLRFVTSATDQADLPPSPAEIAIVGRSNVGKSSLINAVAKQNKLAHTSKTPGRTRLLNMFEVASGGSIVDLPGYGFAKAPANMRRSWQQMIEGYLLDREELRMIVVLVDGEVGPTRLDQQMLDWLRAEQLPHSVVATKHDKVKSAKRQKRKRELAEGCQLEKGDIVWASAAKGVGIDQLRGLIRVWLTP